MSGLSKELSTHHGQNIAKWRELLGVRQEVLAKRLKITQTKISRLEKQELIDDTILDSIAKALGIPVQLLKECDHKATISKFITYINNLSDSASLTQQQIETQQINNPIELVQELYERLLKQQNEISMLKLEIERLKNKK